MRGSPVRSTHCRLARRVTSSRPRVRPRSSHFRCRCSVAVGVSADEITPSAQPPFGEPVGGGVQFYFGAPRSDEPWIPNYLPQVPVEITEVTGVNPPRTVVRLVG